MTPKELDELVSKVALDIEMSASDLGDPMIAMFVRNAMRRAIVSERNACVATAQLQPRPTLDIAAQEDMRDRIVDTLRSRKEA